MPISSLPKFNEWITSENWIDIKNNTLSPTKKAQNFEELLRSKLDIFCIEKSIKIGSHDKPWVNGEIKKLHRLKSREYVKNGTSEKYKKLQKEFKNKYFSAAEKYMHKSIEELKETNPGQTYSILKRMGAQPGDCGDSGGFTLPGHAHLSSQESAEEIANHFSEISQEFPPLDETLLPEHVQKKLKDQFPPPPVITESETLKKIKKAKKPKSGVPGDLPRLVTKEFSKELAEPFCEILNNIVKSAEWPSHWKCEYVTPIGKVPVPENEDDLRPISLTNFFSKVTEQFIVTWLLEYIEDKIDFRQYGGVKGNSISHYIIEFLNFILAHQESSEPTAILACMIDFSKAFNRQNHNLLITKLCDMSVPGWLLRLVMAFLRNRSMVVRYKGATSSAKPLPGGGPQGTLLGLLLFLVLINDAGFSDQANDTGDRLTSRKKVKAANLIHLKYVDDMTLAEAIKMKEKLVHVPESVRPLPDSFHARTGHTLPTTQCEISKKLVDTQKYADDNEMKINKEKTKLMLFNTCNNWDFMPNIKLDGQEIKLEEEMKLLGVHIRSDLKWTTNTANMVAKGYKRIWILRRLKKLGATEDELKDVYIKQIRSILEYAVPVWHSSITQAEKRDIERVQKAALHVILGMEYTTYSLALKTLNLQTLDIRRDMLCKKFAIKSSKHSKHKNWFKINEKITTTRQNQPKYCPVYASTTRFENSPISYLTKLLNASAKK